MAFSLHLGQPPTWFLVVEIVREPSEQCGLPFEGRGETVYNLKKYEVWKFQRQFY